MFSPKGLTYRPPVIYPHTHQWIEHQEDDLKTNSNTEGNAI